ncbi:MAG TPA: cupin domain-containing protein [Solirubrobacteraceae bacterium]|nr:cupin domain-containing protein [Solirubrobacteraceae bacterium]
MTTTTDTPDTFLVMQDLVRLHVGHEQTGGGYFVMEVTVPPGGGPPPIHTHAPHELFFTLEGELTYFREEDDGELTVIAGGPGTSAFIPGGVPHTYRNFSDAPARYLGVLSGATMQDFLVAAGVPVGAAPRSPEDVIAMSIAFGLEWTDRVPGPRG